MKTHTIVGVYLDQLSIVDATVCVRTVDYTCTTQNTRVALSRSGHRFCYKVHNRVVNAVKRLVCVTAFSTERSETARKKRVKESYEGIGHRSASEPTRPMERHDLGDSTLLACS